MISQQTHSIPKLLLLVIGYNRPMALARLLESLSKLAPPAAPVDLLISIDGGGSPQCGQLARDFCWTHGGTRIHVHPHNMGLRTHVESAIDNVADYDAIIVLEDDLSVSPWMFHYGQEALAVYGNDPHIGQISLYAYDYNEFCGLPFSAVRGESDSWLSQVPSSWGQIWTRAQWANYRNWQRAGMEGHQLDLLPKSARHWDSKSWKKSYFKYVVSAKLWTVYPYTSLSTNHGDSGTHFKLPVHDLEVPLEISKRNYGFAPFSDVRIRYDAWHEPMPDIVSEMDIEPSLISVDLYGSKTLADIRTPYLLSQKPCTTPIRVYGSNLTPLEMNVRLNVHAPTGDPIYLGKTSDFIDSPIKHHHFAAHTKRRLVKHLYEEGYQQGQADLRKKARYILGNTLLYVPSKLAALFTKKTPD